MNKNLGKGILLCAGIGLIAYFLGSRFTLIGGPVFAIVLGMLLHGFKRPADFEPGIRFTSKKILQLAVVFLGFGLNLHEVIMVGKASLFIIISTITTALVLSYFVAKWLGIERNIATLVGVGSSICGGSAIAATAPVIEADDDEIATAISVIFLFNILAALLFPSLGSKLGFSNEGFGMWAGTAINDTSSVVAAGQTWASLHGSDVALNYATIVKLTRTLAIIPITLVLGLFQAKKRAHDQHQTHHQTSILQIFPTFILFFLLASCVTTFIDLPEVILHGFKLLSKFFITMAMGAIGLHTNLRKLLMEGGKPILQGLVCWIGIIAVSLLMQKLLGLW